MVDRRVLAREKGTLPEWIVEKDGTVIDLKDVATVEDFDTLVRLGKDRLSTEKMVRMYVAYNQEYTNLKEMRPFLEIPLVTALGSDNVLEGILKETAQYRKDVNRQISELAKDVDAYSTIVTLPIDPVQPFLTEEVLIEYTFKKSFDIFYIFDNMELTKNACFAKLNQFVKVFGETDEIQDKEHWFLLELEKQIQIRIIRNPNTRNELKRYMTVLISSDKAEVLTQLGTTTPQDVWNQIEGLFPRIPVQMASFREKEFHGYYLIPTQSFNQYTFSDFALFDPVVSPFFVSNEISTPSRRTNNVVGILRLPNKPSIRVVLEGKIAVQEDVFTRTQNRDIFPVNSPYVLVRFQNILKNDIPIASEFIAKILKRYDTKKASIETIYKTYIPSFTTAIEVKEVKEKGKYGKAQDIFIPKYPRFAGVDAVPVVLKNEEEVKQYEEKGYQIMKFPREEPSRDQYFYIACTENEKNRFPGVKINNLPNKDQYPVLPKCFSTDQRNKPVYVNYFEKGTVDVQEKVKTEQQRIISTNKFLPLGGLAYLPDTIQSFLKMVSVHEGYTDFKRKGVYQYDTTDPVSKYSFLACILDTQRELGIGNKEYIARVRETIETEYARLQALTPSYDVSPLKEGAYMDPRIYRRFLEDVYDAHIVVFTRDASSNDLFLVDDHDYVLFKRPYVERSRTILVLEHMGAERDYAVYPMCELILVQEGDTLVRTIDPDVVKTILHSYQFITTFYHRSLALKPLTNTTLKPLVTAYYKDYANNVRGFVVQNKYTIFCDPIVFFGPVPATRGFDITRVSYSDALALIHSLEGTLTGYARNQSVPEESNLYFTLPGYNSVAFAIVTSIPETVPSVPSYPVYQAEFPLFEKYAYNKRYARRLLHLFLKRYVSAVPEDRWSRESIEAYANEQIFAGTDYPRMFFYDPELPSVDDIPILSVDNEAIKQGMIKMASSIFVNKRQLFSTIRSYPFVYEYYLDLTDFEESNAWFIVTSYKMYVDTLSLSNSFTVSSLRVGSSEPYNALLPLGNRNRLVQVRVIPLDRVEYSEFVYIYNGLDNVEKRVLDNYSDGLHTLLYKKGGKTYACRIIF